MEYYEKIRKFRENRQLTYEDVYKRGLAMSDVEKPLSTKSMQRIESGQKCKTSTVDQYIHILGIGKTELYKGTNLEKALLIRKNERPKGYCQPDKNIQSFILNHPNHQYSKLIFILGPHEKTDMDYAPKDGKNYGKCVFVLDGQLICAAGNERIILNKEDAYTFDSTIPHYFENTLDKNCKYLVTEYPARY